MAKVLLQEAVYALFMPIRVKYAPTLERIRLTMMTELFNPARTPVSGDFVRSRFEGDQIGEYFGDDIDLTERALVGLRIFDFINKTELKSLFRISVDWNKDYPTLGTRNLKFSFNVVNSFRELLERNALREMKALGTPEPTIRACLQYFDSKDPVDVVSGACSMVLLACLASAGNRFLSK